MYPFPSSTPKFPPLRWNHGSYHKTPELRPTFRAPLSPPGSPFLARERCLPPLPRGAHSRIAANAPQTQRIGIDADSEYKSGTQKFQARIPPSGPSVSSMPDRKSANAPEGGQAPPVRSRLPSQRHRHAHLLAHPPCRLQGSGCLRVVQLAGRVEIPEDNGVFGQTGGFLEQRGERGIHRDALRSQFLQVVSLA